MSFRPTHLTGVLLTLLVALGISAGQQIQPVPPAPCPPGGTLTVNQLRQLLAPLPGDLPVRIEYASAVPPVPGQVLNATGVLRRDTYVAICAVQAQTAAKGAAVTEWRESITKN